MDTALDPPEYGARVRTGRPTAVQGGTDGSDATSTNAAVGYAGSLVAASGREIVAGGGRRRPNP